MPFLSGRNPPSGLGIVAARAMPPGNRTTANLPALAEIGEQLDSRGNARIPIQATADRSASRGQVLPVLSKIFARAGFRPEEVVNIDKLAGCPTLEKRDLLEHRDEMASDVPCRDVIDFYITTGGSTGVPVGFYLQKGVSRPKEQAFLEANVESVRATSEGLRVAVIRGHTSHQRMSGRIVSLRCDARLADASRPLISPANVARVPGGA